MPAPSARATTCHRQAEHTVVRAVSVTAATTACQVTARNPSSNGAAPNSRPRNHSTVTPATRRSNEGPKRRTAGPIRSGAGYKDVTPVIRADLAKRLTVRLRGKPKSDPGYVVRVGRRPTKGWQQTVTRTEGAVSTIKPPEVRHAGEP